MKNTKYLFFMLSVLVLSACNNSGNVKVPEQVNITAAPVTGEVTVKHIISIELPTVFTDVCKSKYNEIDYPNVEERTLLYNQCVTDYINELLKLLGSVTPSQLPVVP